MPPPGRDPPPAPRNTRINNANNPLEQPTGPSCTGQNPPTTDGGNKLTNQIRGWCGVRTADSDPIWT